MSDQLRTQPGDGASRGPSARCAAGFCVTLAEEHMERIRAHARESYPRECCGILTGVLNDQAIVWLAQSAENLDRTRARDRFRIDPREILRADRAAEASGGEVIGFYHSHPDHPAAPSATDLEYAWPGYVYLIAAVSAEGEVQVRAWSYHEGLRRFHEQPVCVIRPVGVPDGREVLSHGR